MAKQTAPLLALLATCSLLFPVPVQPADFSRIDLNALLRIRYSRFDVGLPPLGGPRESLADADILITKGGGVFLEATSRENPLGTPEPLDTFIMRGIATAVERSKFATALQKAQPGIQRDCVSVTDRERMWIHEFIWYGRGSRRQQFRVLVQNQSDGSLPACPKEVVDLIFAAEALLSDVRSHRDTETLFNPIP